MNYEFRMGVLGKNCPKRIWTVFSQRTGDVRQTLKATIADAFGTGTQTDERDCKGGFGKRKPELSGNNATASASSAMLRPNP
jgi:hypothetical protein